MMRALCVMQGAFFDVILEEMVLNAENNTEEMEHHSWDTEEMVRRR